MTDERPIRTTDGDGATDTDFGDIDGVDPEEIAALDDEPTADGDGPDSAEFEEFVRGVDTARVATAECAEDDVPIDASMDELFAER